jgi:signal transduction histidine kinase
MAKRMARTLKFFIVGFWLVFSLSLAGWWMIFGLRQLDRIASLESQQAGELARHQKMLMWEGGALLLLLLSGGGALGYYIYLENKRFRQVNEFFATFSHELKTSIASLRLQAESLQEDFLPNTGKTFDEHHVKLLDRLLKDSVRLELQLENSLFLANADTQLFVEKTRLSRLVEGLRTQWPQLSLDLRSEVFVQADRRAVESVLKNLVQNSVVHGKATRVTLDPRVEGGLVKITLRDNGVGFGGDRRRLGTLFRRHNTASGSGVGLYLTRHLMDKMGGHIDFVENPGGGFAAELTFLGGEA